MRARWLLLACMAVGAAGCGAGETQASMPSPSSLPAVVDGDGLAKTLADLRGNPLVVNVWATWCQPCMAELPDLIAATAAFRTGGGKVLGVSMDFLDPDPSKQRQQLEKVGAAIANIDGMDYQNVVYAGDPDRAEQLIEYEGVAPWTIAVDRAGKIVARHKGRATRAEFESLARAARGG